MIKAMKMLGVVAFGVLAVACGVEAGEAEQVGQTESALIELPPTKCTATTGCGAPTSSPITAAGCRDGNNQCFGAMGSNCTGFMPNDWGSMFQVEGAAHLGCFGDECFISAGSWTHDECCFATPTGHMCNGLSTVLSTACLGPWIRAGHRATHGLAWKRTVDMCRVDTDGQVNFSAYCAPGGSVIAAEDAEFCCTGNARSYSLISDAALASRQGVRFDGTFVPAVCTGTVPSSTPSSGGTSSTGGTAPAPLKTCLSNAQCKTGEEMCVALNGSSQKVCAPY